MSATSDETLQNADLAFHRHKGTDSYKLYTNGALSPQKASARGE